MKKTKAPLGATLVVVSSLFYASYGIWTKLMGDFFDGFTASIFRSIFVLVLLLPIAMYYRKLQPLNLRGNWKHISGLIFSSFFVWGPLYFAILHAGVGISAAVNYAALVIGSFFFGWLIGHERFTKDKAISAVLGLIGIGLIFSTSFHHVGWLALAAAILSGFSIGANTVIVKNINYNSTQSTLVLWATAVVSNVIMASLFSSSNIQYAWRIEWLYMLLFAITSIVASWSVVTGLKLIDAGAAGVLGLLEIVFGVFFGVLFFHEQITSIIWAGIVVIILAAAVPYVKDYNAQKGTIS